MGILNIFSKKEVIAETSEEIEKDDLKQRLDAVTEINSALVGVIDKDKVFSMISGRLVSVLGVSFASIWLWDEKKQSLSLQSVNAPQAALKFAENILGIGLNQVHFDVSDPKAANNMTLKSLLTNQILETTDYYDVGQPYSDQRVSKLFQAFLGMKLAINVPLVVSGEKLGAMSIIWKKDTVTAQDRIMITTFANLVSIAIYNALLFTRVNGQVELLKSKNSELESLYNLTNNISQTLDPISVAQSAVNSLPQDDSMLGSFLNFYDSVQGDIYMKALTKSAIGDQIMSMVGAADSYKSNVNNPADQVNPLVVAIKTGQMQVSNNIVDLMSPPMPKALAMGIAKIAPISSALIYPLKSRNETVGAITLLLKGKKYEELDDSKKQLYSTYALQIGIALENANLFTNLGTALEQLKEARRRERDMLDVMGHELRTPISIVRNALLMLDRDYTKTDGAVTKETLRRYLDMAIESVRREITLIETLLSATKIDASRMQLFLSKVDFKDVVNDGIEGQKMMIQQKGLQLIYNPTGGDVFTYADRTRTQEIMDNFLSNSAKYTNTGSITIETWQDNDSGWIRIKDTGMGISEEDLQNLGKKFFRAKQYIPTKDAAVGEFIRPGGTGLGLYVTFDLIRIMGGKLYINSKVGEGSSFTFSLPVYKNQPDNQIDETFSSDSTAKKEHVILNGDAPQPPQA